MDEEEGRGEEHGRRHPLGRVPVLETDDGLLLESAAICLHVADLYPDAGLIPAPGTYERGLVYQWASFAMTEFEVAMIRSIVARRQDEPAEKQDAHLAKVAAVPAQALGERTYIVGDRFTVADVILGGVCHGARRFSLLPSGRLESYLEMLDARPAKQRAYADIES